MLYNIPIPRCSGCATIAGRAGCMKHHLNGIIPAIQGDSESIAIDKRKFTMNVSCEACGERTNVNPLGMGFGIGENIGVICDSCDHIIMDFILNDAV